jgi:hypothetical protein
MKKQEVSTQGTVITCNYPSIGKSFVFDTAKYPASVQEDAKMHGYRQKFGDAKSGKSAGEKYAEVQLIHASLLAGEWERTATPDFTPLILEAVARIKGLKVDLEKRTLAKGNKTSKPSEEQVKEWSGNAKVRAMMQKIRAEKLAKIAEESEDEIEVDLE